MRLYSSTAMALVAATLHSGAAYAQSAAGVTPSGLTVQQPSSGVSDIPTALKSLTAAPADARGEQTNPGFKHEIPPPIFSKDIKEQRGRTPFSGTLLRSKPKNVAPASAGTTQPGATQQLRSAGTIAPEVPTDIAVLARSLKNDPDLIYEFVRDNIELYPVFGVHKGAVGALIDRQGSNYDQIELFVLLLRASGYKADFVRGMIGLPLADIKSYYGVNTTNLCALEQFFAAGRIPLLFTVCNTAASGMRFEHLWARVTINGQTYDFDPSLKAHTIKTGIDLKAASGYVQATLLADASAGATITTNSAKNINRANVRNRLTGYANNLIANIRTNTPAGSLEDVVGGKTINVPTTRPSAPLRQTSLPYVYTPYGEQVWTGDIPLNYRSVITVNIGNAPIGLLADDFYGSRLTISPDANNNTQLMADGNVIYTWGQLPIGYITSAQIGITHNSYQDTAADQTFGRTIYGGETTALVVGFGPTTRRLGKLHRERIASARLAGSTDASEPVLGGNLAAIGADVQAETSMSEYLTDRIGGINSLTHHFLGTVTQRDGGPVVDLSAIVTTNIQQDGNVPVGTASIITDTLHSSSFESGVLEQMFQGGAASTVRLLDDAIAGGETIYNANSANFASEVQPNLLNCSAATIDTLAAAASTKRLFLPQDCARTIEQWRGLGYISIAGTGSNLTVGALIQGGYSGGYSGSRRYPNVTLNSSRQKANKNNRGDPVDMVTGNFNYSHDDIAIGPDAYAGSLSLQKVYNSGSATADGPLGRGWSHNLAMTVQPATDAFQGIGEDSPIDAATSIVEHMVALDLITDATLPIDKLAVAVIGHRWFSDQLNNNAMSVNSDVSGSTFIRLPDGTFNSPPNDSSKLNKNADGTFTQSLVDKTTYQFDASGNIATRRKPNGEEVHFGYTNGQLTSVQNSFGRSLTLTYAGTRISSVQDGAGRFVNYGYDAAGNLTSFTDAAGKSTTFAYDQLGRMSKFYLPAIPAVPQVQNVYDILGRVDQQTDADGKIWQYRVAGSRSELVSPLGNRTVDYYDGEGRITATLEDIDAIGQSKGYWQSNKTFSNYDGLGRLVKQVNSRAPMIQLTYDDASCNSAEKRCTNNVTLRRQTAVHTSDSVANLADITQSFTYESQFNKVATATDGRGKVTNYSYDLTTGNLLSVTRPPAADGGTVRPQTIYSYTTAAGSTGFPSFSLPTSETRKIDTSASVTTTRTYDSANGFVPKTKVVDSGGLNLSTTYAYDTVGNLTSIDGPRSDLSDVTSFTYDAERRMTSTVNALGKSATMTFNEDGDLVGQAAQIGVQWSATCYNRLVSGKVSQVVGPALVANATDCPTAAAPTQVTDLVYNDDGRLLTNTTDLAALEGGNRTSKFEYTSSGELVATTKAVGTPLEQSDPKLSLLYSDYKTTSTADATTEHRLFSANNGGAGTAAGSKALILDGHGRLKSFVIGSICPAITGSKGCEQYVYDANDNVTKWTRRDGAIISYTYDNLNRVTQKTAPTAADSVAYTYDLLDRPLSAKYGGASGASVTMAWDKAGRQLSETSSARTVGYLYDAAGNRIRTTWPDTVFYVTYDYDALNRVSVIKEKGVTSLASYGYDDLSRRTATTYGNGTSIGYGYNAQTQLSSLQYDLAGTTGDVVRTFGRDQAGAITSIATSNASYDWNGFYNINRAYTNDGEDRYLTSGTKTLAYDNRGNLTGDGTWAFSYDPLNRLKTAVVKNVTSLSYTYDPLDRLSNRTLGKAVANYLYEGDQLIGEYSSAGALVRRYVRAPGIDEPLVIYDGTSAATKTWLYADHEGSITATANAAGTPVTTLSYGPFGEPSTTTGVALRYTGQQLDPDSGLYYYKARWYSPYMGRFLSPDPTGVADGMHLYAYVGNDPINYEDTFGLNKQCAAGKYGKFFSNNYEPALDMANKYGMDVDLPLGVAAHESGWNTSSMSLTQHNPFGATPNGFATKGITYNSYASAWQNWGNQWGNRVQDVGSDQNAFINQLKKDNQGAKNQEDVRGPYNTEVAKTGGDPAWSNKIRGSIAGVRKRLPAWLASGC